MLPEQFLQRMRKMLSDGECEAFLESFDPEKSRHHALRLNILKTKDKTPVIGGIGEMVPWEKSGYYYSDDAAPGKHPYHEAGLYYIQEPSAMAPVHFLNPKPGEKILDLCAAPGGKSTQIACKMDGQGILISNEINRDRAKILSLNVERLGITNCMVLNETPEHLSERFEGYFDKILVDAPCSGEGMFRKNEIATTEWSPENVENCALRQKEILECASRMLAPGGTLVYSTCTFAPAENEESIYRFLLTHKDYHVHKVPLFEGMDNARKEYVSDALKDEMLKEYGSLEADSEKALLEVSDAIRLWPHKLRGEGHFLCVLKRDGELKSDFKDSYVPGGRNTAAKKEIQKVFLEFASDALNDFEKNLLSDGVIFSFGDQLYLSPKDMPSTGGLKVIRPGLHLGTVKKDRVEPSHALALALNKEIAKRSVDFTADSDEIRQFLNGQTIRISDKNLKGWTLITVDGYSIGWTKAAAGMLKNHYPKGLRINY